MTQTFKKVFALVESRSNFDTRMGMEEITESVIGIYATKEKAEKAITRKMKLSNNEYHVEPFNVR